jgi:uncharacterized membrane protein YfcA
LAHRNWPLIVVGVLGAVIGNLTAIGGGIVFLPVMIFGYGMDPVSALKLAFATQAVGMSSGAVGWLQRGNVPTGLIKWTVPGLVVGASISTFVLHPQAMLVKGLFGPVSFLVGLFTLITLNRNGRVTQLPRRALIPLGFMSVLGGLITGWVAIGEGEIVAAFCMLAYGLNADRAIGLGVVLLSLNSILLAVVHALHFGGVPWDIAIFTMLGALFGGRLGPYLAQRLSVVGIKRIFAIIAILDGLLISFQSLRTML